MTASITCENNCLFVAGELNFMTVTELWEHSLPLLANCTNLCFDLSKITSVNSGGLALLLEWLKYAKCHRKSIQFNHVPSHLKSIATVSSIDKIILF